MEWFNNLSNGKKALVVVGVIIVVGFIGDQAGWWEMSALIGGGGPESAAE